MIIYYFPILIFAKIFIFIIIIFLFGFFFVLFCFFVVFFFPFALGHSKLSNFRRIWIINDYLLFRYHKFLLKFLYLLLFFFFFFCFLFFVFFFAVCFGTLKTVKFLAKFNFVIYVYFYEFFLLNHEVFHFEFRISLLNRI